MTVHPRLSRPFCVSMLALAGLLVLSYFPLSGIRAASAGATILPSAGKPLVNLKSPQTLKVTYTGSADAVAITKGCQVTGTFFPYLCVIIVRRLANRQLVFKEIIGAEAFHQFEILLVQSTVGLELEVLLSATPNGSGTIAP